MDLHGVKDCRFCKETQFVAEKRLMHPVLCIVISLMIAALLFWGANVIVYVAQEEVDRIVNPGLAVILLFLSFGLVSMLVVKRVSKGAPLYPCFTRDGKYHVHTFDPGHWSRHVDGGTFGWSLYEVVSTALDAHGMYDHCGLHYRIWHGGYFRRLFQPNRIFGRHDMDTSLWRISRMASMENLVFRDSEGRSVTSMNLRQGLRLINECSSAPQYHRANEVLRIFQQGLRVIRSASNVGTRAKRLIRALEAHGNTAIARKTLPANMDDVALFAELGRIVKQFQDPGQKGEAVPSAG